MKFGLIFGLILGLNFTAQAQYHNDIQPIRQARNEARDLVKSFKLVDLKLQTGAPEYRDIYNNLFIPKINEQIAVLEKTLTTINNALAKDYSLVVSLQKNPTSKAMRETIKVAEERLKAAADKLQTSEFHASIKSLMTLNYSYKQLAENCLSVLCVNQVKLDYLKWLKLSKRVNKPLDLVVTEMKAIKWKSMRKFVKTAKLELSNNAVTKGNYLPVSITSEEYQAYLDSKKVTIAQLKAGELPQTDGQYGCESTEIINEELSYCVNPYFLLSGEKALISSANFNSEKHEFLCRSMGMSSKGSSISWNYDEMSNVGDSVSVQKILCKKDLGDRHDIRLVYTSKSLMEDGSYFIKDIAYKFAEKNFSFSKSSDPNELCKFFKYQQAHNTSSWTVGYADNSGSYGYPRYKLLVVNADGTVKKEVMGSYYSHTWSGIICKN